MEAIEVNLQDEVLKSIKAAVLEIEPEAKVILFGSRARGDVHGESDWDVLILVPYDVNFKVEQKFRHRLFYIELDIEQVISTFVFSEQDWETRHRITPFYENVKSEGIEL